MHLNFSLFNKVWDMVISTSSLHEYLMGLHFYVSMKLLFRIVYVFGIKYFSEQILLQRSFFIHFKWLSEMQKLLNSVYKIYLWIQVETWRPISRYLIPSSKDILKRIAKNNKLVFFDKGHAVMASIKCNSFWQHLWMINCGAQQQQQQQGLVSLSQFFLT